MKLENKIVSFAKSIRIHGCIARVSRALKKDPKSIREQVSGKHNIKAVVLLQLVKETDSKDEFIKFIKKF